MSSKKLPDRYFIQVAEDVRSEGGGKFSLMGISQKGLASIASDDGFILPSLAVYGMLYNLRGYFEGKIIVKDSNGEIIIEAAVPIESKEKNESKNSKSNDDASERKLLVAGKFMNVKFKTTGKFTVSVMLDDKAFTESFKLLKPVDATSDK
jgi:hypothetical protein